MNLKRTATICVGGAAFAAWLYAAITPGRPAARPVRIAPSPIDASGAELAGEIKRLHERLRPTSAPTAPSRNPFAFGSNRRPSSSASARREAATLPLVSADLVAREPVVPLPTLAGVAEDPGTDGLIRTAIISADGQVFLAKPGDTITDHGVTYEVGQVTAESVELIDLRDHSTRLITLK
jgi:hypothetical protein